MIIITQIWDSVSLGKSPEKEPFFVCFLPKLGLNSYILWRGKYVLYSWKRVIDVETLVCTLTHTTYMYNLSIVHFWIQHYTLWGIHYCIQQTCAHSMILYYVSIDILCTWQPLVWIKATKPNSFQVSKSVISSTFLTFCCMLFLLVISK